MKVWVGLFIFLDSKWALISFYYFFLIILNYLYYHFEVIIMSSASAQMAAWTLDLRSSWTHFWQNCACLYPSLCHLDSHKIGGCWAANGRGAGDCLLRPEGVCFKYWRLEARRLIFSEPNMFLKNQRQYVAYFVDFAKRCVKRDRFHQAMTCPDYSTSMTS